MDLIRKGVGGKTKTRRQKHRCCEVSGLAVSADCAFVVALCVYIRMYCYRRPGAGLVDRSLCEFVLTGADTRLLSQSQSSSPKNEFSFTYPEVQWWSRKPIKHLAGTVQATWALEGRGNTLQYWQKPSSFWMSSDQLWCQSSFRAPSPLPLHHNPSVSRSLRMSSPLLSPQSSRPPCPSPWHCAGEGHQAPAEVGSDVSYRGCAMSSFSSCLELVENYSGECFPQVGDSTVLWFCNILGLKWALHCLALVRFVCSHAHRHLDGQGLSLKSISHGWC